jgi:branched-chain amino acid transport system ATP-binding protein
MSELNGSASESVTEPTVGTGTAEATSDGTLLSTSALDVRYGSVQALFEVSIEVPTGSVVAVLGANGAGKSTFARAVSGLIPSFGGRVMFDGRDITKAAPYDIRRGGLVHIPEGRGIFPGLSVQENLRMAVRRVGTPDQRRSAIDHAYDLFPRLAERRSQRAGTLSGGEQQMLAVARALMQEPRVLLLDEMSMGLAPIVVEQLLPMVRRIADETDAVVVLVEQHVGLALEVADRAMVLVHGVVSLDQPAREVKADSRLLEAAYFGQTAATPG